MPIPKRDTVQIYKEDLEKQEINPDSINLRFNEPCPFNKTLFKITPEENAVLEKLAYSIGPNDKSLNGYVNLILTRIENTNMFIVAQAQNQILWSKIITSAVQDIEYFHKPIYLYKGEPVYIQAVTNFPAPCKVLADLTFTVLPTFR